METQHGQYIVCETPSPGVRVVRFIQPEYHEEIYDHEPVSEASLYKEIHETVLAKLAEGETLILNCGLIESFASRLYGLLLALRAAMKDRKAHLVLCRLTPIIREAFDLFGGWEQFEVKESEHQAVSHARKN